MNQKYFNQNKEMPLMGYQNRADTDKERIEVLEIWVNKNSKTELGREKVYEKKKPRISKKCETITKGAGYV